MIVVLRAGIPASEVERLREVLRGDGYECEFESVLQEQFLVCRSVSGAPPADAVSRLMASEWVTKVFAQETRYPRIGIERGGSRSRVAAGNLQFGRGEFGMIVGPCTVEDEPTLLEIARFAKTIGAGGLRGGAYKPTTSPYSFQGHGQAALKMLERAREETGLAIVTELIDVRLVEQAARAADVIQIGARSMQNFPLLREVGQAGKPVLLKRGMGCKIHEWLCAAEYIADAGNERIVLCERGIRSFDDATRACLDVSAIPAAQSLTHLPVIFDPSHASGNRNLVEALALAGTAAGADGVMIEVHPHPERAIKDGAQSVNFEQMSRIAQKIWAMRENGLVAEVGLEPTTPRV